MSYREKCRREKCPIREKCLMGRNVWGRNVWGRNVLGRNDFWGEMSYNPEYVLFAKSILTTLHFQIQSLFIPFSWKHMQRGDLSDVSRVFQRPTEIKWNITKYVCTFSLCFRICTSILYIINVKWFVGAICSVFYLKSHQDFLRGNMKKFFRMKDYTFNKISMDFCSFFFCETPYIICK